MIHLLYNIFLSAYYGLVYISSPFNHKANKWVNRTKIDFLDLNNWRKANKGKRIIWLHSASLGEYEEAQVWIKELRNKYHNLAFILSFYSSSGFEHAQIENDQYKFYLPLDYSSVMTRLVNILNPSLVLFIKYEYWYNLLMVLYKKQIPYGYTNSRINGSELFFRISKFETYLKSAFLIHSANKNTITLLSDRGFSNIIEGQDTRLLKALINKSVDYIKPKNVSLLKKPIMLFGSIHSSDEKIVLEIVNNVHSFNYIIAPHFIEPNEINRIRKNIEKKTCSIYDKIGNELNPEVIIVDTIGDLKFLYRFSELSYVGGGFEGGIHNIVEALIYNTPVFYGKNQMDNNDYFVSNLGIEISSSDDIKKYMNKLELDSMKLIVKEKMKKEIEKIELFPDLFHSKLKDIL